jgi:uncharacterized PurR-regulated membrane protein YhhQ (DUF165 family)
MSLRVFHMVFVVVTVLLSLYVGLWGIREFSQEQSAGALVLAVIFLVTAVAMAVYGKKAYGKLKELP